MSRLIEKLGGHISTRVTWYQRLTPQQRAEADEVLDAIRDGTLLASKREVSRQIVEHFGLTVSPKTIMEWLCHAKPCPETETDRSDSTDDRGTAGDSPSPRVRAATSGRKRKAAR